MEPAFIPSTGTGFLETIPSGGILCSALTVGKGLFLPHLDVPDFDSPWVEGGLGWGGDGGGRRRREGELWLPCKTKNF